MADANRNKNTTKNIATESKCLINSEYFRKHLEENQGLELNSYELAMAVAHRARQIVAGSEPRIEVKPTYTPVTIAARELAQEEVKIIKAES